MGGETQKNESDWTVDTLHYNLQQQLNDLKNLLQERYETQTKEIKVAFTSAEKFVKTALSTAEKAVDKAETANEKRFESVNEFRAQLSDQTKTFLSRTEVAAMHIASDAAIQRNSERISEIAAKVDQIEVRGGGTNQAYIYVFALIAALGTFISIVVAFRQK